MRYIAHRGLLNGPDKNLENSPDQIEKVLKHGYDCEVDVWAIYDKWFLGHDEPQYEVPVSFLGKQGLWIHCKNLDALYKLNDLPIHYEYFWHQNDDFTLTSGNFIWTYPGKHLTRKSIAVLPEINQEYWDYVKSLNIFGVCTDYVEKFISETSSMSIGPTKKLF
jgi:hypothetical protein